MLGFGSGVLDLAEIVTPQECEVYSMTISAAAEDGRSVVLSHLCSSYAPVLGCTSGRDTAHMNIGAMKPWEQCFLSSQLCHFRPDTSAVELPCASKDA